MAAPRTDVDIEQYISNINWNAGEWQRAISDIDTRQLDKDIEEAIFTMLQVNFAAAMDEIDEYQQGPLREHLLDMLESGSHVIVVNGQIRSIFNIIYAGNYEDVKAGQVAAGADFSKPPHKRSIGWQIIYDAANHGIDVPRWAAKKYGSETYSEIIQSRIDFWGDKAPYWIFVEFGTAVGGSPGTPYPSFGGRNPIYKTQQQAEFLAQDMRESWQQSIDETLSTHVEERFVDDRLSIDLIQHEIRTTWTKSFRRGQYMVQLEQLRGKFTGRYRITGPAE